MAKKELKPNNVTNLKIERSGGNFTVSWTNASSYSKVITKYKLKVDGTWGDWQGRVEHSGSTTQRKFTVSVGSYYPPSSKKKLNSVRVLVAVEKTNTSTINYKQNSTTIDYDFSAPEKPTISVQSGASSTSFTYSVSSSNGTYHHDFQRVQYDMKMSTTWGAKDPKDYTGWSVGSFSSNASNTISHPYGSSSVSAGQSITVLCRIQSQGVAGDSGYSYSKFIYAFPLAASNLKVASVTRNGSSVSITWSKTEDSLHPVKQNKVEYYIGKPANSSLACPSGVQWSVARDYENNTGSATQQCTFTTSGIGEEECMWVRVWQKLVNNLETATSPLLVSAFSVPKTPSIESISYNASSHVFSVSVDKNSELTTGLVTHLLLNNVLYEVPASGTVTGTQNLGTGTVALKASNTFGAKRAESAITYYNPTLSASDPDPYYPVGVKAQKDGNGGVTVSWTPVMSGITGVEVAVYTNIGSDPISTHTGGNVQKLTITGLSYDSTYYFRVRTTNEQGTTDYSAEAPNITLTTADAPKPDITLTELSNHDIRVSFNWSKWNQATGIEFLWSQNASEVNNSRANWEDVARGGKSGTDYFYINGLERGYSWYVWARFQNGTAVTGFDQERIELAVHVGAPSNISFVRRALATDEQGKTTALLSWSNSGVDTDKIVVSWDTNPYAWDTTSGAAYSAELDANAKSTLIPALDLGTTWYARVRTEYDGRFFEERSASALDLRTKPSTPAVSITPNVASQFGKVDVSWTYTNEDGSEQASASLKIYDESDNLVGVVPNISNETAVPIYSEQYGLSGGTNGSQLYYVSVQTMSANGILSDASTKTPFTVINKPIAVIESTSLVDVIIDEGEEDERTIKALETMPLTVSVSGANGGGQVFLYIERSASQPLARPDESIDNGYEGELVVSAVTDYTGEFTIGQSDLRTNFTESGQYTMTVVIVDSVGTKSDPVTLDFTVMWEEHAVMPTATYVVDQASKTVQITPVAGTGTPEDATFEIYRLSADRPELIAVSDAWEETFVDPYPALGEYGGHMVVCVTSTGDYTTEDGGLAWLILDSQQIESDGNAIVDFDGGQIAFNYNVGVSHSWEKDFTETKYLGGSIQGDWNPAVSRKTSLNTVMITLTDSGKIELMRRLATHTGLCHVRTPDGSSFAADVQVSESWDYNRGHKIVDFSMDITRVDSEGYDAVLLADGGAE